MFSKRLLECIKYGFVFAKGISSELPLSMYPGTQRADPSLNDLTKQEHSCKNVTGFAGLDH